MSLWFYLTAKDVDGNPHGVLDVNITHNLGKMADAAGIYYALWRPEEKGWTTAKEILPVLKAGLKKLKANPKKFKKYDAPNGWGLYEHFVPFVEEVLASCEKYPSATIHVSR